MTVRRWLACYDHIELIGCCQGRRVMALTNDTSIIESVTGASPYRRQNKPALGPLLDPVNEMGPYK